MTPTLQFLFILVVIILGAKAASAVSTSLGQPGVLGELLLGLILGPSLLNIFGLGFFSDSVLVHEVVVFLADLGVILLMFLAGVETELTEMRRVGRVSLLAGILGVVFPLVLVSATAYPFNGDVSKSLFIGIILGATSVSISVRTLMDLGALTRVEGLATLGAAVVDDIIVILVLSIFTAFALDGAAGPGSVLWIILRMAAFGLVSILVGLLLFVPLARWASRTAVSEGLVSTVLVVTLVYAFSAEYLGGIAAITGSFIAGLLFGRTDFRHVVQEKMHTLTYAFFVPVFFVSIGLESNLRIFGGSELLFVAIISIIAIISKIVGCGLGARISKLDNMQSLRIGVGMVSRGEVGLIVAAVGLTQGLINSGTFSAVVVVIIFTTVVTPVLLRLVFPREAEG